MQGVPGRSGQARIAHNGPIGASTTPQKTHSNHRQPPFARQPLLPQTPPCRPPSSTDPCCFLVSPFLVVHLRVLGKLGGPIALSSQACPAQLPASRVAAQASQARSFLPCFLCRFPFPYFRLSFELRRLPSPPSFFCCVALCWLLCCCSLLLIQAAILGCSPNRSFASFLPF